MARERADFPSTGSPPFFIKLAFTRKSGSFEVDVFLDFITMENIIIPNPEKFKEIKKRFIEQGAQNLHVLTDFDRTLTKAFVNGQESSTSFAQIRNGGYLGSEYSAKTRELFAKYHPIEIDSKLTVNERAPFMLEWWKKHFELLIEYGFNKNIMAEIVSAGNIEFRSGTLGLLKSLHAKNVPVVIMSAGLGDMVLENLRAKNSLHDNIYTISNLLEFDAEGKAVKSQEPIIHSMNKHEISVPGFPIFEKIKDRKNVLLIGDTLEDVEMIDGFVYDNLIKIGFFNENPSSSGDVDLEAFKKKFDVIILNDGSMDFVLDLCKEIN